MRMMHADSILIAYQLPFLQLLIFGANLVGPEPAMIRWLMVIVGAFAGVTFYALSSLLWGKEVGFLSALFFSVNPFLIIHSLVPYQEILMLLLLCGGLTCLFGPATSSRRALASLCFGLACLTRYEAWIITALAAWFDWRHHAQGSASWRTAVYSVALYGWAPLLWAAWQGGLSPTGTFVLEGLTEWQRLYRVPYVLGMTLYHAGPLLVLAAAAGAIEVWRKSLWRSPRMQLLLWSLPLFLAALLFSAHGVSPDPARYVTDREAHWPLLFVLWLSALGLYQIKKYSASRRDLQLAYMCLIGICLAAGLYETQQRLNLLTSQPDLTLDYQAARFLDRHLPAGKKALVLARPAPASAIQDYLDHAGRTGRPKALQAAKQILKSMEAVGPVDYSRIVVNSRLGKGRILSLENLTTLNDPEQAMSASSIGIIVRFSDFQPRSAWEVLLSSWVKKHCTAITEFTVEKRAAVIFEPPARSADDARQAFPQ